MLVAKLHSVSFDKPGVGVCHGMATRANKAVLVCHLLGDLVHAVCRGSIRLPRLVFSGHRRMAALWWRKCHFYSLRSGRSTPGRGERLGNLSAASLGRCFRGVKGKRHRRLASSAAAWYRLGLARASKARLHLAYCCLNLSILLSASWLMKNSILPSGILIRYGGNGNRGVKEAERRRLVVGGLRVEGLRRDVRNISNTPPHPHHIPHSLHALFL